MKTRIFSVKEKSRASVSTSERWVEGYGEFRAEEESVESLKKNGKGALT